MNDIAKEVISVLEHSDKNLIVQIPEKLIKYLKKLASTSNKKVKIDANLELANQAISEESKDLIALIYYKYISNDKEKQDILNAWTENEKQHQKKLKEKYDIEKIFKQREITNNKETQIITIQKTNIVTKIIQKIKKLFNR